MAISVYDFKVAYALLTMVECGSVNVTSYFPVCSSVMEVEQVGSIDFSLCKCTASLKRACSCLGLMSFSSFSPSP